MGGATPIPGYKLCDRSLPGGHPFEVGRKRAESSELLGTTGLAAVGDGAGDRTGCGGKRFGAGVMAGATVGGLTGLAGPAPGFAGVPVGRLATGTGTAALVDTPGGGAGGLAVPGGLAPAGGPGGLGALLGTRTGAGA